MAKRATRRARAATARDPGYHGDGRARRRRALVEFDHQLGDRRRYEALETRFAPTLAGVIERGTLPKDSEIAMHELYAFVASQAVRTPRIREKQLRLRVRRTEPPAGSCQITALRSG